MTKQKTTSLPTATKGIPLALPAVPIAKAPARILLVDDHPMVRERLAQVIIEEPELTVCGEAEDRRQALRAIYETKPDLVIVDLTLKNSHGLELIKDIAAEHPKLAVLVLSLHDESLYAERVIRAGARGYITKQEATRNILLAIRRVLDGNIYLNEKTASRLAAKIAGRPHAEGLFVDRLTDRELQVFEQIGQGHGTRDIASGLDVDVSTVETYRARIKEKLQLKDASELLRQAIHWVHSGGGR
jgi:DNA-binding NarL/FixJ family response regulator